LIVRAVDSIPHTPHGIHGTHVDNKVYFIFCLGLLRDLGE
jgi:hypothetical protein